MYAIPNIPPSLCRAIYADVCKYLPPPAEDTPEAHAAREERAMAMLAHLLPENAAEAEIAVDIVAADFHAKHSMHAAAQSGVDPDERRKHFAQAGLMSRTVHSGIRTLQRMQAERQKAEDARRPAAMERAGYWYRDVSVPEPPPPAADPLSRT